jgi:hypothetical protein
VAGLVLTPAIAMPTKKKAAAVALSFDPVASFTPANADPKLAAALAGKGLALTDFKFTPAPAKGRPSQVRVAIRARVMSPAQTALAEAAVPTAAVNALTPTGYNLGVAVGWPRVAAMYSIAMMHATPLAWTPLLLERVLFDVLPHQATTLGEDAGPILRDLVAFCAYMGRVWGLPQAAALCRFLSAPDLRPRFAAALDDEARWSVPKRVLIKARRAGVKTADREALYRWMRSDPELSRVLAGGPAAEA